MPLQRANKAKWFLPLVGKSRKQLFNNALRQTKDGEALCKDHLSQWQSSIIPLPECIKDSCASQPGNSTVFNMNNMKILKVISIRTRNIRMVLVSGSTIKIN